MSKCNKPCKKTGKPVGTVLNGITQYNPLKTAVIIISIFTFVFLVGCNKKEGFLGPEEISKDLTYNHSVELEYAETFTIDEYDNGCALISVIDDCQYLVVPENTDIPKGIPKQIVVLKQPIDDIYLAASAAMDMFDAINGMDSISFSSLQADDWSIASAAEALNSGKITYAGKYSAPDYEQLVSGGCDLALENTMIYHMPENKEQLEKLGIPVFVEYSSYETHPLGRMEWVKLYGRLTGHYDEAVEVYNEQINIYKNIAALESNNVNDKLPVVAYFYISSDGLAKVRKSSDYMAKMIEMAGGRYAFDSLGEGTDASSTVSMTMEEFYMTAKDADYIIYNSTIDEEINCIDDLISKSEIMANFKAVKDNNVFCTTQNVYQSSMDVGTIISDIYYMLKNNESEMKYIYKVNE